MTWIQIGVEKIHKETKYVLFLDDDVRLHPGSIGALTLEMEKNPEVCIEIFILFTLYIWAILISSFPSDNLLVVRGPLFYVCGLYIFSVFLLCCRYSFRLDTHLIYPLGVWGVTVYMNTIWYEVFTITRSFFFFALALKIWIVIWLVTRKWYTLHWLSSLYTTCPFSSNCIYLLSHVPDFWWYATLFLLEKNGIEMTSFSDATLI